MPIDTRVDGDGMPAPKPCEQQVAEMLSGRDSVQAKWDGALSAVDAMIAAAEAEAATYSEGSVCRLAFQAFADKLKAKRDALVDIYMTGLNGLVTVTCDDLNWQEKVQLCEQILGQMLTAVDKMWELYRRGRKKDVDNPCEDFMDYEPDTALCSMLKADANVLINLASAKFDQMFAECQQKLELNPGDVKWLTRREDMLQVHICLASKIPPEVSCTHKEWEERHNQRLGAAKAMHEVALCLYQTFFAA